MARFANFITGIVALSGVVTCSWAAGAAYDVIEVAAAWSIASVVTGYIAGTYFACSIFGSHSEQ